MAIESELLQSGIWRAMRLPAAGWLDPSRPKRYRKGRVCAEPDCGTILSVYNGEKKCARHAEPKIPRMLGVKGPS